MDAWWLAPVVVVVLSGVALLVAGAVARHTAVAVDAEMPALLALRDELTALHDDLAAVATRLDGRTGGAGAGTTDR